MANKAIEILKKAEHDLEVKIRIWKNQGRPEVATRCKIEKVQIRQAIEKLCDGNNADTGERQSNIPDVSNCKPTGYEKNNLPIEIRHAYCEAIEIYQHILSYEYGIITKDEFIKEVEVTKRKH